MKQLFSILFSFVLFTILLVYPHSLLQADAKTLDTIKIHSVNKTDSLKKISLHYGVSELAIKNNNGLQNKKLTPGDKLIIPEQISEKESDTLAEQISEKEKDLLARLVTAEAKGEPYKGKVAVAEVVLNRVESEQFPNSIHQVIYQDKQFEPVENGMINKPAGQEAKKAVNEALSNEGKDTDALYFFNPDQTSSKWLRSREVTEEIGHHRFAL